MAKYNITEKKEKAAAYRSLVSPRMMDEMQEQIMNIIVMQKKYRDKDYSAKKLAADIGTNTRYISAVVNVRFHMNYSSFVNYGGRRFQGRLCKPSSLLWLILQVCRHYPSSVPDGALEKASVYGRVEEVKRKASERIGCFSFSLFRNTWLSGHCRSCSSH